MAIATHTHLTIRICVRMSGARARKGGVVNPFLARAPFPARAPNVRTQIRMARGETTHTWPPNMERRCRADTTVFTTGSARCV